MSEIQKRQSAARPWLFGLLAVLGVWTWQATTVRANYAGNWTALFCTAGKGRVPPELEAATYGFTGTDGYDGQFYRLIAHDPWMRKGYAQYLDDANLRYRRILQAAVAWALAGGRADRVDTAYFASLLLFVGLGTAFSVLYLRARGRPEYWAMLFPILPGVLVCVDRMTVDVPLYACLAAGLAAAANRRWALCYAAAACAALARDLGFLLPAALVLHALVERAWIRAAVFATAGGPAVLWYLHLKAAVAAVHTPPVLPAWAMHTPLLGHLEALLQPAHYPMDPVLLWVTQTLDRLVLAGVFLAVALVLIRLRRWPPSLEVCLGLGYVAVFLMVGTPNFWRDLYSSFRAFTPLLVLVAMLPAPGRFGWHQVPLFLMTFRFLWQLGPQVFGIVRSWGLVGS